MKKTLTTGLMIVLSAAVLSACGTDGALNAASLGGSDNAFSQLSLENGGAASMNGFRNKKQGPGAGFALGFLGELNLSDDQKAEIQSIMEAAKADQPKRPDNAERPAPPDAAAVQAVQDKISAAFLSDSFDAEALHAEMESLRPAPAADRPDPAVIELARAQQTLNIWNVLSAEQKATVTEKAAEFANKMAGMDAHRPGPPQGPEGKLSQLSETLSLTAEQQAALTAAFEDHRPAAPEKPDPEALITLLNSGSATAESIAALHTRPEKGVHNPLSALAAIHSVLSAEQRQNFVDIGLLKQPGPGHQKDPAQGLRHPGGPGGPGGPGAGHPMMGQRPGMGERPDFPLDVQ